MTANEQFLDAMIRHQIFLLRVSGSVRNQILEVLEEADADLKKALAKNLKGIAGGNLTPARAARLERVLKQVSAMRTKSWEKAEKIWLEEIAAIAQAEPAFIAKDLKTVLPVVADFDLPSPAQLKAIATATPFEGRTLKEWSKDIARADIARIQGQIRIGMVQGETVNQISRRIVGSAQLRGADGVTNIARQNAQAITRTAVNHVANQAKREFYKANSDLFTEEQYVATLDARTTAVCRANDGKRFEVGRGPIPPLHFNCRSLRVAVIGDKLFGNRPFKPTTERMLVEEYARNNGLGSVRQRAKLPRGHKGSYDTFARARTRELIGQAPADLDYGTFLRRQGKGFQEDVLGVTKAKLFRDGKLPLDKFVNRAGDELTLAQLARRHKTAFQEAGLDPEDFF